MQTRRQKVISRREPGRSREAFSWDNEALVEEFLAGIEVTCGVLGSRRRGARAIRDDPNDEIFPEDNFLYGQGENKTPPGFPTRAPADPGNRGHGLQGLD